MENTQYDPDDFDTRSVNNVLYFFTVIFILGSIVSVIYFIYSVASLCKGERTENILISTGLLVLMAVLNFFLLSSQLIVTTRDDAKTYFLLFAGIALDLAGATVITVSVLSLCHEGKGALLLAGGIAGVLAVTSATIVIYRRIKGYRRIKLFTDKNLQHNIKNIDENAVFMEATRDTQTEAAAGGHPFCHKCGEKLPADSEFCPYCGTKLNVSPDAASGRPEATNTPKETGAAIPAADDSYYRKQAEKIASHALITTTKFACYIALAVFLFFNIKMAPSSGTAKSIWYVVSAGIGIGLVVIFNKKVLQGTSKPLYTMFLIFSVIVIVSTVGLRIVYEAKVDHVAEQFPFGRDITLSLRTETEYYNETGTGVIREPFTYVEIGGMRCRNGDKIIVKSGKVYPLTVQAGGSYDLGSAEGTIMFHSASFSGGQYTLTKTVRFFVQSDTFAEVKLIFERYCNFWEVIFY